MKKMNQLKSKKIIGAAVCAGVAVAALIAPELAMAAGQTHIADGVSGFGSIIKAVINVLIVCATAGGLFLCLTGAWGLKQGAQGGSTPAENWKKLGIGFVLANLIWLIDVSAKDMGNDQGVQIQEQDY